MLITRNEDEYYQTALALSNDSAQLNNVREMVLRGKENSSLFKTPNFIKKLENVYLGLLQK